MKNDSIRVNDETGSVLHTLIIKKCIVNEYFDFNVTQEIMWCLNLT
jgi:hypothetical protein